MISLDRILESHKKISPYINYTPLIYSDFLSKNRIVKLKLESFQNISEEAKLILYNPERYEKIREESIIATNQRFLAVRRIERWWINTNWNPKYKRCRERLDREYQELFVTK